VRKWLDMPDSGKMMKERVTLVKMEVTARRDF